jgi:ATP-binding cassette, subfamily B, multidrug efflux pump
MNAPLDAAREAEIEAAVKELEARAHARGRAGTEALLTRFHEETTLGRAYDTRLMARLWPYVRPHARLLWVAVVGILFTAVGSLLRPVIMKDTIDGVLGGTPGALMKGGLILVSIVLAEQALSFAQIWATQIVGARSMADLRSEAFAFIHRLRLGYFDRTPVGRLVTRVTNDVDAILELFASGALNAFGDLVRLVGIVALMIALDWKLALTTFAAAPPVALMVFAVRKRSREAFREIRAKTARMNANMNEQVSGMVVVQAFTREEQAASEFDSINAAYRDANIASIKFEAMQDAAIEMVSAICMASIVVALGFRQDVSFGTLVAFSAYITQFFEPISALAQRYTLLQSAMAGAERVFGLLDNTEHDAPPGTAARAKQSDAPFAFEGVSFEYKPGVPVLHEVTVEAKRGEKIALVGPTGAGKSTLASLLLRLYDATEGVVRVDGVDVRALDRDALRERYAVVPQDVYLFPGTVASNVAAGSTPDPERVREALRRIGALELFERRPEGIDARVEEHGQNFSAGERQLLAFARALYRDRPVLILDEATASVDSDTEARLQRALDELMRGRTSLVIAHRLSTIRAADRILVFQAGRIVEQGSHDELVAKGGLYARLYELQFSREGAAGDGSGLDGERAHDAPAADRALRPS